MCGIVGAFGAVNHRVLETFELMLSINSARGLDSTGVAVINKDMPITKDTILPLQLIRTNHYDKIVTDSLKNGSLGYIGHSRSATSGKVTRENSHPFQHKHITLVHNGTLLYDIQNNTKTETDSESICIGIAERGIADVWKELDGAASLVWWDALIGTMNLITNGKRPLVFGFSEDRRNLYIGSEPVYVRKPLQAMGIKLKKDTVWKPNDDTLYHFTYTNNRVKEFETKLEPKPPFSYTSNYRGFSHGGGSSSTGTSGVGYADWWKEREKNGEMFNWGDEDDEDSFADSAAIVCLDEATFNKRYKQCYFCHESLEGQYKEAKIVDENIAVCEGCTVVAKSHNIMLTSGALRGA